MNGLILICAGLLSAGATFVTNWLALIPWRRSRARHWTEQARLVHPVMVAARSNLWVVPGVLVLTVLLFWPESSPLWVFTGIVSVLGAYVGTLPLDLEVSPRISLRELLRLMMVAVLLRFLIWFVFISAAVFMPDTINSLALAIAGTVGALGVLWARGGFIWMGRKLGLILPATERLQNIAARVSDRMNIPFREILLMHIPVAQAVAFPGTRRVAFTTRLLEIAPDDELAAICAHELAHLTESRTARSSRFIGMLAFLPWILFNPLTHAFGALAVVALALTTSGVPKLYHIISRKLESRADVMARANEGEAGTYARALARLHEDNLSPAVMPTNRASHPHLYDRMLAAGVTPDFPRPKAGISMAWNGQVFAGLAGLLFACFALRLMQAFVEHGN